MTNKEAIKELSEWLDGCCGGEEIEPTRQALRLAISALQAQEAKTQLSAEGTTSDLISRRVAVDALWEIRQKEISDGRRFHDYCSLSTAVDVIKDLPSAQPEPLVKESRTLVKDLVKDTISRQAAISELMEWVEKEKNKSWSPFKGLFHWTGIKAMLECLPSAQPEMNMDEWCTDCKEYDHEKHCCPRWNRVIRQTLKDAQTEPQWIPVSERLPEEYGNYLISIHGEDEPDIGTINPNDKRGWSLCDANGFHWASDKELIVTAWMPLPGPYRAERRTDDL